MSVPITVLGVTSLWPTTGDTGYSAQAEQLQKLLAQAVAPIEGLYGVVGSPPIAAVGKLGIDTLGQLTLQINDGPITPITGLANLTVTSNNGITSSLTNVDGDYSLTLGLGNITPSKVNITAASGTDGLVLNNASVIRAPLSTAFASGTRTYFQTTNSNSRTSLTVVPNGTPANTSVNHFLAMATSDTSNTGYVYFGTSALTAVIRTDKNGTGTDLPLVLGTAGGTAITIDTSNNVTLSGTISASNLSGTNTGDQTITLTGAVTGSGTGSFVTTYNGVVPINKGGTGQTTANAALNALLPSQTGNAGKTLTTDGTNTSWSSSGSGSVTSVSVVTANGISGTVANPTTTPAITLSLGDITPNKVTIEQTAGSAGLVFTNASTIQFPGTSVADSPYFTSSLTNTAGRVRVLPSGTATTSAFNAYNSSNTTNNAFISLTATSTGYGLTGGVNGTGTALPLTLTNSGTIGLQVETTGNVTIPTNLSVTGAITSTDSVQFDTGITPTTAVGKLQWDPTYGTLQFGLVGGNVNLQVGQEMVQYVLNKTGSNLLNAQIVRISGAQGARPTVVLAQADTKANSIGTIGMLTENINNNQQGFVTTYGIVHDVNTGSFADGDTLYLSATTPGGYTNVQPASPAQTVIIGYVIRAHATVGEILIDVQGASDLSDMSDVDITSPTTGQVLAYNGGYWANSTTTATLSMPSLTLTGTGSRITADMSNATAANRLYFQSSTTNGVTRLGIIPNGTSRTGALNVENSSDPTNNNIFSAYANASEVGIGSYIRGTATLVPFKLQMNSVDALTLDTAGKISVTDTFTLNASAGADALVLTNASVIRAPLSTSLATGSRSFIQTSTANDRTIVSAVPNGTTSSATGFTAFNLSTPANSAYVGMSINASNAYLQVATNGTGTNVPLIIGTAGGTALTVSTANVVTFANTITGSISGNAATATKLATARNINGVAFDGTADITVTAAAGTLTGTTLNSTVVNSSLTSVGTVTSGWITPQTQASSVATSTTINWANKDVTTLTLTGNTAITNSGAVNGQKMILQLVQGGSGSYTVTFTSETKFGTSFTSITLSTAVGKMDMIGLVYSSANSKYNIVSFAAGY